MPKLPRAKLYLKMASYPDLTTHCLVSAFGSQTFFRGSDQRMDPRIFGFLTEILRGIHTDFPNPWKYVEKRTIGITVSTKEAQIMCKQFL